MKAKDRRAEYIRRTQMICAVCKNPIWHGDVSDIHHAGTHDKKGSNTTMPLFTDSLINQVLLHRKCHEKNPGFGRLPAWAAEGYENLLQTFRALVRGGVAVDLVLLGKELEIIQDETKNKGIKHES